MCVDFLYSSVFGRLVMKAILNSKLLPLAAKFMQSPASRIMIRPYIQRNNISMDEFQGQRFNSFADFFARFRPLGSLAHRDGVMISPCDGLLSIYDINDGAEFRVKGSLYRMNDLIPEKETADKFKDGLCMIFRLRANDYHHFCYIDDCIHSKGHWIDGKLHAVQPIACSTVPVYRLNRRQWSLLHTKNFGLVAQIEVGAMLVGGIVHNKAGEEAKRGEEMGHFELAGSTIILLFTKAVKDSLRLMPEYCGIINSDKERHVRQGAEVASIS